MRNVNTIAFYVLLFVVLAFLQSKHVFAVAGVAPNILLVALLVTVFSLPSDQVVRVTALLAVGLVVLSILWFPFWIQAFAVLALVAVGTALIKPFLGGKTFIDFALCAGIATIIFYIVMHITSFGTIPWLTVGGEAVYTILMGEGVLLVLMRKVHTV